MSFSCQMWMQDCRTIDSAAVWQRNDGDCIRFDRAVEAAVQKLSEWRSRCLQPWKHEQLAQTDEELEQCIDAVFVMYCAMSNALMTVSRSAVLRMCRDARALDVDLTTRVRSWLGSLKQW
jgi:hypothetical protein